MSLLRLFAFAVLCTSLCSAQFLIATSELTVRNNRAEGAANPTQSSGSGWARVVWDNSTNTLSWEITYADLTGPPTDANFHLGNFDDAGEMAVNIPVGDTPLEGEVDIWADGVVLLGRDRIDEFREELLASNVYLSLRTEMFPAGEIRVDQLVFGATTEPPADDDGSGVNALSPSSWTLVACSALALAKSLWR